ncbi:MAG: DALR domain-containing protein, partial [Candidatus Saccharibacteria bacterium]
LEAFRLLVLESQYRSEAQFSWETLNAAQNRLDRFKAMAQLKWQANSKRKYNFEDIYKAILNSLQDDLNTPKALTLLSEMANEMLEKNIDIKDTKNFSHFLQKLDSLLGTKLSKESDINSSQKILIINRENARNNNNWPESDKIRSTLNKQGINIRDTEFGQVWNKR